MQYTGTRLRMTIAEIEAALRLPLPGKRGQYLMAPSYRPDIETADVLKLNPKIGGVLLLLDPKPDDIHVILTLRKTYPGTHSGQMSFPGGKREDADPDIMHTSLRETQEEIGVSPEHIRVIGQLTELYIPPSNFLVYPTVGVLTEPVAFKKQEEEVEEIVSIPLSFFTDERSRSTARIKVIGTKEVEVPAFNYLGYVIWGATAIMLSEFVYILTQPE